MTSVSSIPSTAAPTALDAILNDLLEGDFQQRWQAMKGVLDLGEIVIAPLLTLMQNEDMDWEVRWFAARALGQFPKPVVLQSPGRSADQYSRRGTAGPLQQRR